MMNPTTKRTGFTLIELLTVISLIGVLGAMGVYFLPSFNDSARAAKGAGQLQNWLQIARTRAMRDGVPTGLRMQAFGSTSATAKFQYVAQPDDYSVGQATVTANSPTVTFSAPCDLFGSTGDNVRAGDFIEFLASGLVHQIKSVDGQTALTLVPNSAPQFSITPSGQSYASSTTLIPNYRIIRQARVSDDEVLELPSNIVVEPGKSIQTPSNASLMAPSDVLFSPSGSVMTPGVGDRVIFWVRDVSRANVTDGDPTLIVVYARSGSVAAFPVNPAAGSEYSLVK
ncbi:MAG: prepilin-type N-terminal cleavage/methylation domain-containing protein [Gemmataceae bacterium]|nr:prepilin-type N-terminal cleavage/methylation domain-containing protein [Gemmataceae bacterium]